MNASLPSPTDRDGHPDDGAAVPVVLDATDCRFDWESTTTMDARVQDDEYLDTAIFPTIDDACYNQRCPIMKQHQEGETNTLAATTADRVGANQRRTMAGRILFHAAGIACIVVGTIAVLSWTATVHHSSPSSSSLLLYSSDYDDDDDAFATFSTITASRRLPWRWLQTYPPPTPSPTPAPTVSPAPTDRPSASPTASPTISVMPSSSPTISHLPTISVAPSFAPSPRPTRPPTRLPVAWNETRSSTVPSGPRPTPRPTRRLTGTQPPTDAPSSEIASPPSDWPSSTPSSVPTTLPLARSPTFAPSAALSSRPAPIPTREPIPSTPWPTPRATPNPTWGSITVPTTPRPTRRPTPAPAAAPEPVATVKPNPRPTPRPTFEPVAAAGTVAPDSSTPRPTPRPTTDAPVTPEPTWMPVQGPTTPHPTQEPSVSATDRPSTLPTLRPTVSFMPSTSQMPSNGPTPVWEFPLSNETFNGVMITLGLDKTSPSTASRQRDSSECDENVWTTYVENKTVAEVKKVISQYEMLEVNVFNASEDLLASGTSMKLYYDIEIRIRSAVQEHDMRRYVQGPFVSQNDKSAFIRYLRNSGCSKYRDVNSVELSIPVGQQEAIDSEKAAEDSGFEPAVIAGLAAVAAAAAILAGIFIFVRMKNRDSAAVMDERPANLSSQDELYEYYDERPDFSTIERRTMADVSTLGDPNPLGAAPLAGDASTIASGSLDYDYQKAYAQDMQTVSEVSTVPGDAATTSNILVATDDDTFDAQYASEEMFEVVAPAGVLGMILESRRKGVIAVNSIKESSVLYHDVQVGDHLKSLDGEDVTVMMASEVSKLIASKKDNSERRFVFSRPISEEPDEEDQDEGIEMDTNDIVTLQGSSVGGSKNSFRPFARFGSRR